MVNQKHRYFGEIKFETPITGKQLKFVSRLIRDYDINLDDHIKTGSGFSIVATQYPYFVADEILNEVLDIIRKEFPDFAFKQGAYIDAVSESNGLDEAYRLKYTNSTVEVFEIGIIEKS